MVSSARLAGGALGCSLADRRDSPSKLRLISQVDSVAVVDSTEAFRGK